MAPIEITVFHGTDAVFEHFDRSFLGAANGTAPINKTGFNFTSSKEVAATFGRRIVCAKVAMRKPFVIDAKGSGYSTFKHILNDKLKSVDRSVHDGVIIRNYGDAGIYGDDEIISDHFIPFSAEQITVAGIEDRADPAEKLAYLLLKYAAGVPEYRCEQEGATNVGTQENCFGHGAICTSHAEYIATQENGLVCGFFVEDNPCEMSKLADGHDFALIDQRFIVDTWLSNWEMEIDRPVLDLESPGDRDEITRWYGDPGKWVRREPRDRQVYTFTPPA